MREEQIQEAPVKVLLVGVDVGEEPDFERSMEELASLAEAAEKEVAGQIVQRLDQPVEGVLVFGKTPQATAWLNKQHQNGMMKKEYLAVFTGTPVKEKQGIWEDYLIKDGKTNTSQVTGKKDRMAKKAVLSYRIMDWRDDRGLAEIRLGTGRHHQIRVQMAHHGMPLWADGKYKKKEEMLEAEQGTAIGLCAWRLEFAHPKTGKKMKFEVQPEGVCFQEFSEAIKP